MKRLLNLLKILILCLLMFSTTTTFADDDIQEKDAPLAVKNTLKRPTPTHRFMTGNMTKTINTTGRNLYSKAISSRFIFPKLE